MKKLLITLIIIMIISCFSFDIQIENKKFINSVQGLKTQYKDIHNYINQMFIQIVDKSIRVFNNSKSVLSRDSINNLGPENNRVKKLELPALVIMYDDGNIEDYTEAFPIHKRYQVPGVIAVNPGYIGGRNKLDIKHLKEMKRSGWEIANHGYNHTALIYNSITQKLKKGDKKIKVKNSFLVNKDYSYKLFNAVSKNQEIIKIGSIQRDQDYLNLQEPISQNYSSHRTYITLSNQSLQKEIVNSKKLMEEWGFNIDSFVYPYNGFIKPAVSVVKHHYSIARGGRKLGEKFPEAFINIKPLNKYKLKGVCFENNLLTETRLEILLNKVVARKGLLIMYAHSNSRYFSTERLQKIIESSKKKGIEIVTMREVKERLILKENSNT